MAMISLGRDASKFFPDVVKQVICDSLEVKKLAYQFLTHYAEAKSNEASSQKFAYSRSLLPLK